MQDLGPRLCQQPLLVNEVASDAEEAVDVGAFLWLPSEGRGFPRREGEEVKPDLVDRDSVLAGAVLPAPGQEGLDEEEGAAEEDGRLAVLGPVIEKLDAIDEVEDPGSERFQGFVRDRSVGGGGGVWRGSVWVGSREKRRDGRRGDRR